MESLIESKGSKRILDSSRKRTIASMVAIKPQHRARLGHKPHSGPCFLFRSRAMCELRRTASHFAAREGLASGFDMQVSCFALDVVSIVRVVHCASPWHPPQIFGEPFGPAERSLRESIQPDGQPSEVLRRMLCYSTEAQGLKDLGIPKGSTIAYGVLENHSRASTEGSQCPLL
jgi:hypothetical protein